MARRSILVLVAPLLVAALGCTPPCDDAGLRSAAMAFGSHTPESREAGLAALEQACPTLPSALRWSLLADFGSLPEDQRVAIQIDRASDPLWNDLLERTCPRAREPLERGKAQAEHDRAMRSRCELDRYGLLAPDEPFAHRDLGPFMLYEWLVSQRVSEARARELVRPLLVAEAVPAELEAACLRGELPCDAVLEAWGLRPPVSNGDVPLDGAAAVRVTASAISVEGEPVVRLEAGRPEPGAFVDHVSSALLRRLDDHPVPTRRPGVVADRATPVGTIVDITYTASRMNVRLFELVVQGEHGLVALPLFVPFAWTEPPEREELERALELVVVVRGDDLEVLLPGASPTRLPALAGCEPSIAGCHDHAALEAHITQLKHAFPHETEATFRVAADVPVQALVSLVDTVRGGKACALASSVTEGEEIPPQCLFWQATLDLEPPMPRQGDLGSRGGGGSG